MDVVDGLMRFEVARESIVGIMGVKCLTDGFRPKNKRGIVFWMMDELLDSTFKLDGGT